MVCNFSNVAFHIFGFSIHWYSFAYILGIIFAVQITKYLSKKMENGSYYIEHTDDFINAIVVGIILGGRLGHVFFYESEFYFQNPAEIFKIWKGGMSFFGGFLGVVISTYFFCKKYKINFLNFMDLWSVSVPVGLFLGRIANFVNGELLGIPNNEIAWAVIFRDGIPRHPSQIYEAILEGIVLFGIMLSAFRLGQHKYKGKLCGIFCAGYGVLRFIGEIFREPDSVFSWLLKNSTGLNLNQYFCFAILALGLFLIFRKKNNVARTD